MSLFRDLEQWVDAAERDGRWSDRSGLWRYVRDQAAKYQLASPTDFETAMEADLADQIAPERTLGPCWELLELLLQDRQQDPTFEADANLLAYCELFERLLHRHCTDREWATALNRAATGNATFEVEASIEFLENGDHAGSSGRRFCLKVLVPENQQTDWLSVYVFQRSRHDRWSPLFPNRWEFRAPYVVPGVSRRIPGPGQPYTLRTPSDLTGWGLRVIASRESITFPVHYIHDVTRFTGTREARQSNRDQYLAHQREAYSRFSRLLLDAPGLFAQCTVDIPA